MQNHRSSLDRLQLLSSTLSSQLIDAHERDRVRHRLNEITRRWTQLEQDLLSEEETLEEMKTLTESFEQTKTATVRWINQTRELNQQLTNSKTVQQFDQFIPKGKTILFEYPTYNEQLQRLRTRFNRLVQTNKTPNAVDKVFFLNRKENKKVFSFVN